MQTFLPYKDYQRCALVLDRQRLGCQRKECMQILQVLLYGKKAWSNHPVVLMWKGYEYSLCEYMQEIIDEWLSRGYVNNMSVPFKEARAISKPIFPWWLGKRKLHAGYRSNLLAKKPEHYSQFGWKEPDNLEYWWPTKHGEKS